jgi:hypothetical protein
MRAKIGVEVGAFPKVYQLKIVQFTDQLQASAGQE